MADSFATFDRRQLLKSVSLAALSALQPTSICGATASADGAALYNVTNPITTAQGELVFTVWRKYFFQAGSVTYTVGGGTAVVNIDYDGSLSPLSGTLNFAAFDICKHIRIQTFGTGGARNKPASGSAQVSLNITLTGASGGRIEDGTGSGTIQSGVVYYFSATGNNRNAGTAASPFAYLGSNGVQAKMQALAPGTMLRLKRGDTWTLGAGNTFSSTADFGGSIANPAIIGAYGSGTDPIITNDATYNTLGYLLAVGGGTPPSTGINRVIFEDFILQPGSDVPVGVARDYIRLGVGFGVLPQNRDFQRLTLRNPSNYQKMSCGVNGSSGNRSANFTYQFLDIADCDIGILHTGTDTLILGCYIHDVGCEPVRQWAIYTSHCLRGRIWANRCQDNIQSVKLRSANQVEWRWNYFDSAGLYGTADIVGITNAVRPVVTIANSTIPAKRLVVGKYFSFQGLSGTGWESGTGNFVGGNGGCALIVAIPGPNQYQIAWDTSAYAAYASAGATVSSNGRLTVAFGFDVTESLEASGVVDCLYENNFQRGAVGFGFGVAEGGVPPWGQGFVNFTVRNNIALVNVPNPTGTNLGCGIFVQTPFLNGVGVYNNTVVIDGLDYNLVRMPFTQETGGNNGPVGSFLFKNNLLKRINVSGSQYLATFGAGPISGLAVLSKIILDNNLWDDSTAAKFASVNSGADYGSLSEFKGAFAQEASGISTSVTLGPYLGLGNLAPPNGSPVYVAGQSGLVTADFIGNGRSASPSIGAIQNSP